MLELRTCLRPFVDSPRDFGRIAAAHALSAVHGRGALPLFASLLLALPFARLPADTARAVIAGATEVCEEAGVDLVATDCLESDEAGCALSVTALADPRPRPQGVAVGDRLVLSKPLGVGIYGMASRRGLLMPADETALLAGATLSNRVGTTLACLGSVHALTAVGTAGLLGALRELVPSDGIRLRYAALPLLPEVSKLLAAACVPPLAATNLAAVPDLAIDLALPATTGFLLGDPQMAGGLLVACAPDCLTEVLAIFLQQGYPHASVIGEIVATGGIVVA